MFQRYLLYPIIILSVLGMLLAPVSSISISCTSGGGSSVVSSSASYDLDDSTSLREEAALDSGTISRSLQASGSGRNAVKQQIGGAGCSADNTVVSDGSFSVLTSATASSDGAGINQQVAGAGDASLASNGAKGSESSGQEANVLGGSILTSQSISVGSGIAASQSTEIYGVAGSVASGAVSDENIMAAKGSFLGAGTLSAKLSSTASDSASASGEALLDGVKWLDEGTFQDIASASENKGMGMAGLRAVGDGIGTFDMSVVNLEMNKAGGAYASQAASQTAGGSYSSYALTGCRWNQRDPKIQLYLNPANMPQGLTENSSRDAISAAANTWDDAVAQNLFADGHTVIVDPTKQVDNPFAGGSAAKRDGYSVNGWWSLGGGALGVTRWWTDGQRVNGYYSITEADTWYASDKQWTTDWDTAVNSSNILDLQSVAVHELGHSIGLDDLYTLPSNDARRNDFAQVMNAYDGAQRVLGNGDTAGAQKLYGDNILESVYGNLYRLYDNGHHFFTINYAEAQNAALYGYHYEGLAGYIYPNSQQGMVPLYRLYSNGDHFYTTNYAEAQNAALYGYQLEGVAGYVYSDNQQGVMPLYRLYSNGDHFYTVNYAEAQNAVAYGYKFEGVAGYIGNAQF